MLAPSQAFQFLVEDLRESPGRSKEGGLGCGPNAHAQGEEDLQKVHLVEAGHAVGLPTQSYVQEDHDQEDEDKAHEQDHD
jgi:hypothetical protein